MSSLPTNATAQDRARLGRFNSVFYGSGSMGDLKAANRYADTGQQSRPPQTQQAFPPRPTIQRPGQAQPPPPQQPQVGPPRPTIQRPGQAQPQQNLYGSATPYGGTATPSKPGPGRPSVPMTQDNAPGQAKPQQSPYDSSTPYGGKPQNMGPQWNQGGTNQQQTRQQPFQQYMTQGSPYGGGNQFQQQVNPNVANNAQAPRPPAFQAQTFNFDGTQSQMPNFQQRDAFISQINNQLGQMQGQSWQQPGMGAPQFNFPQMWGQAGEMAQQGFQNPFAQAGQGMLGTLQQQSTPSMYSPPQGPLVAGEPGSAQRLGIQPSVTYAQPGGGWGHTPQPPGNASASSQPTPVLRRAEDYPGPVSPGTAQPIPPQSQGTPPALSPSGAPWQAGGFDGWWDTRKEELLAKSREVRAQFPDKPGRWAQVDAELKKHQDNRSMMSSRAKMLENRNDPDAKRAYNESIRQDQLKRSAAMQQSAASQPPAPKGMNDFYRDDGSYDFAGAQREWQAKYNAKKQTYMKQPVAKRNATYGSDSNRRAYEMWMR